MVSFRSFLKSHPKTTGELLDHPPLAFALPCKLIWMFLFLAGTHLQNPYLTGTRPKPAPLSGVVFSHEALVICNVSTSGEDIHMGGDLFGVVV